MTMGANPNLTCCVDLWSSGRQVETETVEEAEMQSLLVNDVTNETLNLNAESTLPGEHSDADAGMDHKCETIREMSVSQLEWTALHTASAHAQQHTVQSLLEQGADVNAKDVFCRTPLDVAGSAHHREDKIDENNFMETVDLLLKAGGKFLKCRGQCFLNTPLHTAVELGSEAAVRQILQGGASVTAWNKMGDTAMHVCVEKRNEILLELLASHQSSNEGSNLASIDVGNSWGRTVLCSAVHARWIQGIDIVLGAGATNIQVPYIYAFPVEAEYIPSTVIHLAAHIGNADVLKNLLDFYYYQDKLKEIVDTFDMQGPPIYYAIKENNADCVRLLIDKRAKVNLLIKRDINEDGESPLLELAVWERNTKIAEMIMIHDREIVHTFNSSGESPLYVACIIRDKKMIALLLQYGADLSGGENEKKLVPVERLMKTVSKATEFLKEIFDSNIRNLPINKDAANVHFKIFVPRCGRKKMKVIQALLDTGNTYNQQDLLLHPLVESFLYLQWRSLLPFFYTILALHVFFVLSLNVFVLSLFWYKDKKIDTVPIVFHSTAWICIIYLTAFVLTIQELITIKKKTIRYLLRLEMAVKCLSTIFAFALPPVVLWDSTPNSDWVRLFGSVTLLLAGVRMMYLLSRLPDWGYYVLMYGKVAIKVFKVSLICINRC